MELESPEVPSDDGKGLLQKNSKRTVKTRDQLQALEKFYNEHKYPTEAMKLQVAESIGLTEKQVSGWFCHRRLKDKKLTNGEIYPAGKQDRSSGLVQDHCSGHRQDSCGSTKQGDDRIFDTKEVVSGRLIPKEFPAAENYNHTGDPSSGSSSSLQHESNNQDKKPFGAAPASTHRVPKFPTDVKSSKMKPRPSGYLKVKGRVENPAITAVKRHLGKHYRDDGPPLAVEFDMLPPGAFESLAQDPIEDTCYTGEAIAVHSTSDTVANIIPNETFGKGYEYKSSSTAYYASADGASFEVSRRRDIPSGYVHPQIFKRKASSSCYRVGNFSSEFPEGSDRYMPGSESRLESRMKSRADNATRIIDDSYSHFPHRQPYSGKVREEPVESWFSKEMGSQAPLRQNVDTEYANLTMNRKKYHISEDKPLSSRFIKDSDMYSDNMTLDQNRINLTASGQIGEEFRGHPKSSLGMRSTRESASSSSKDEESADTTSYVD